MKYEVFIKDDVAYVVILITPDTARVQPIITKEAFIECYDKWIKPIERKDEVEE
jgi:hypothetical protein